MFDSNYNRFCNVKFYLTAHSFLIFEKFMKDINDTFYYFSYGTITILFLSLSQINGIILFVTQNCNKDQKKIINK